MLEVPPRFQGVQRLFGQTGFKKISSLHLAVIGIGGVGSWAAEAMARSGVGKITLVDLDDICETNINRQLHSVNQTIGHSKVKVMEERIKSINPDCEVVTIEDFFTKVTAEKIFLEKYDGVIDAIDSLQNKVQLLLECKERNIPLVVCGGAGAIPFFENLQASDLGFSIKDRLLMHLRKRLRQRHGFEKNEKKPWGIDAVYFTGDRIYPSSDGETCSEIELGTNGRLSCEDGLGTACFTTGSMGLMATSTLLKRILND